MGHAASKTVQQSMERSSTRQELARQVMEDDDHIGDMIVEIENRLLLIAKAAADCPRSAHHSYGLQDIHGPRTHR